MIVDVNKRYFFGKKDDKSKDAKEAKDDEGEKAPKDKKDDGEKGKG